MNIATVRVSHSLKPPKTGDKPKPKNMSDKTQEAVEKMQKLGLEAQMNLSGITAKEVLEQIRETCGEVKDNKLTEYQVDVLCAFYDGICMGLRLQGKEVPTGV